MSAAKNETSKNWNLTGPWAGAYKIFGAIGVIGLAGAGFGYTQDPRRFAFSWMFAFITVLTVALGSLFFVLVQHLTSAGWSVTVRRTAEFFAYGLLVMPLLFLPVLATMNQLFPWLGEQTHEPAGAAPHAQNKIELVKPAYAQEHAAEPSSSAAAPAEATEPGAHAGPHTGPAMHGGEHRSGGHAAAAGAMEPPHEVIEKEIMRKKSGYLNRNFFLGRAAFYFLVWIFLATRFFGWSTSQDKSKDPKLTVASQRLAPIGTVAFALTLTFAAFDWIMSLEPTWFSTIFGVVIFACGVVSSYAVIILATLALRNSGPLDGAVTIEHYHDLGKLMFGFLVFWAYVSFSQFMLIWYAALPEETTFFHNRWDHDPWMNVSLAIIVFHFVVPFFWTISRNFKRNVGRLQVGAAIILVMHAVDIYWFVMPNFLLGRDGFSFHWMDIACLLAVAGVYGAFVFYRMTQFSLVPVGDPRLQRSLHFQNA